jgi:hypothetical protein
MKRFAVVSLTALALFAAGTAAAQTAKWDQAKVTALAGDLANSVSNLQNQLQNNAQAGDPFMEETVWQVGDSLGLLEFEATRLQALLQSGKGMKQTLPAYKRLQQLHRECQAYTGQFQQTAILTPSLAKAKAALSMLSAYYPPQPALTQ